MLLSPHFSLAELTRSQWAIRHGVANEPSPQALARLTDLCVAVLEPLRTFRAMPVMILSGYRNPEVNAAIGGSPTSQHMAEDGAAADIMIAGLTNAEILKAVVVLGLPYDQLIEEFGSWVHVSHGPRNRRQVLSARRTSGGTVYEPLKVAA